MGPANLLAMSGLRVDTDGMTMKGLISRAYKIDSRLIVGPGWIMDGETRFAIHAVMPEGRRRPKFPICLERSWRRGSIW